MKPAKETRFEVDAWEDEIAAFVRGRSRVSVTEIAREALGLEKSKIGTTEQRRIGAALGRLRWKAFRDWQGRAFRPEKDHDA